MNETQIAEQLANRIPRDTQPVSSTSSIPAPTPLVGEPGYVFQNPLDELSMYKIFDFFNIPIDSRVDPETNSMITKMVEWASQNGATEYYDIIKVIRDAQRITGTDSIKSAYRFAKLDMQSRALDREMRSLYA
jgi:hypothetical protein